MHQLLPAYFIYHTRALLGKALESTVWCSQLLRFRRSEGEPYFIYRKNLRPDLDLADIVIKWNLFSYSHNIQRRDEYLRALYFMHQGMWICPFERWRLCIFQNKVHQGLQRSEGYPLPLPCSLSDIFERLRHIAASNGEERTYIDAVFTIKQSALYAWNSGIKFKLEVEKGAPHEYVSYERFETDDLLGVNSPQR